jgi:hypothetical protein
MQPKQAEAENAVLAEEAEELPNLFDLIEHTGLPIDYQGPCVGDGGAGDNEAG